MEVVASLSQGRTAAAQCGFFTHKSIPVIFEPPCITGNYSKNFDSFQYLLESGRIMVMVYEDLHEFLHPSRVKG